MMRAVAGAFLAAGKFGSTASIFYLPFRASMESLNPAEPDLYFSVRLPRRRWAGPPRVADGVVSHAQFPPPFLPAVGVDRPRLGIPGVCDRAVGVRPTSDRCGDDVAGAADSRGVGLGLRRGDRAWRPFSASRRRSGPFGGENGGTRLARGRGAVPGLG